MTISLLYGVFSLFGCALSVYHLRSYWVRACLLWVGVVIEHMLNQNCFKSAHREHKNFLNTGKHQFARLQLVSSISLLECQRVHFIGTSCQITNWLTFNGAHGNIQGNLERYVILNSLHGAEIGIYLVNSMTGDVLSCLIHVHGYWDSWVVVSPMSFGCLPDESLASLVTTNRIINVTHVSFIVCILLGIKLLLLITTIYDLFISLVVL